MMLSCKEATQNIEKQAEGKLSGWERFKLRLHMALCKNCAWFQKQFEFIKEHAAKADEHMDDELPEDNKAKLRSLIKEQL